MNEPELIKSIAEAKSLDDVERLRVAYLGRKGSVTEQLKGVGTLPPQERGAAGKAANQLRLAVEKALTEREEALRQQALAEELAVPYDVTAPGIRPVLGHRH